MGQEGEANVEGSEVEQRRLGRTGLKVGAIGLGTEHLVHSRENMAEVVRVAVEAGVNFVDVLYEDVEISASFWDCLAPAVAPYRDKLAVVAHWGPSYAGDVEKGRRRFEEVLERLGGSAEVGMVAVIDEEEQWQGWGRESVEVMSRYREEGKIGHIGFSGHRAATALKAVDSGLIDVLMFPINMLKHDDEEMPGLYDACQRQNVGLVAMKPYSGSTLLQVHGKPTPITPVQCLAYVLSQPVATVVPGVKTAEELRATLHYLEATQEEKQYGTAIANLPVYLEGICTYCRHCLPCPEEIEIPDLMLALDFSQAGVTDQLRSWYDGFEVKASACTECGVCMERCPFKVDVIAKMKQVVEVFEGSG
jgi:predicted aldo/keto reductase-like oxidoreductase